MFAALTATTTNTSERNVYLAGLGLIALSLIIYLFSFNIESSSDPFTVTFFLNYCIWIAYGITMIVYKMRFEKPRPDISNRIWINFVLLVTISAFSLNATIRVFAVFPIWLSIYTIASCLSFLLFPYINNLPSLLRPVVYLISGAALVLSLYMLIYLAPLVPLSVIIVWFFGMSLHTFVPVMWIWVLIDFLFIRKRAGGRGWIMAGIAVPLLFLGIYLYRWNSIQSLIKDVVAEKNIGSSQALPDVIVLAQKLPADPLSEQIIISPFRSQRFWESGFGLDFDGEQTFHDPLSLIGMQLFGDTDIDHRTAESLLNIRRDYRHKTQRKLWTGTSLSTGSVSNNIQVFPEYRIAYQEKILTIHNDPNRNESRAWFTTSTQEAAYTFHLPEGSIVTSLSLWINGKEEKSRLTTRQKADSAYTTIVGVERRDPALVHWQEGNRITVTVFPCTPEENRTFKIGFTTPLTESEGKLWLENVWFEGPDINNTREVTQVAITGQSTKATDLPDGFDTDAKSNYVYKGDYNPYWKMGFEKVPLSKESFSFNGSTYSLAEVKERIVSAQYKDVYLDVMKDWSRSEFDAIMDGLKGKDIYVWLPERIKVTAENKEKVWSELSSYQYSVPFLYQIADPSNSVVLTKSGHRSPLLSDLKNSEYAELTTKYLNSAEKVKVIGIGDELSPFWKSLHELRLVDYTKADVASAIQQVNRNEFKMLAEDSSIVSIASAGVSIIRHAAPDSLRAGKAPDHLLRMYAYNDVMRRIGKNYFKTQDYEETVFREAEEGYVVSPVTSMIVLESLADYDRMGIEKNRNTVGNAGILSGGAVPEPHEWALIAIVAALVSWHLYRTHKERLSVYFKRK